MNKERKTIKQKPASAKVSTSRGQDYASRKTTIIAATLISLVVILCIAVGFSMLYKPTIFSVDGQEYKLEDMKYFIHQTEVSNNYLEDMFQEYDGSSYWKMDIGDGKTMHDLSKEEVLSQAVRYEVMYREAVLKGYELTDEDRKNLETTVDEQLKQMSDVEKSKTGFNKEKLTSIMERVMLVDKYYSDLVETFDIDEEAIKAKVKFEEYRQYNFQELFIEKTDEGKEENKAKLTALLDKAKKSKDFHDLVDEDKDEIVASDNFFVKGDETVDPEIEAAALKMKNGDVSDVIETETGYYIIRMVNNKSTEGYDSEVEDRITEAQNEEFDKLFEEIKKNYDIEVNNFAWKRVKLGSITM